MPEQSGHDRVSTLNAISWHYRHTNVGKAFLKAKEALSLAFELESGQAVAASLGRLGDLHEVTGNYDSALLYYDQSLQLKTQLGDSAGVAATLNGIGMVHDQRGNDEKALASYFHALRTYEALQDKLSEAMVLVNIGIVYKKQKEYSKALDYYQRALAIYESERSDFGTAATKGNIGAILLKLYRYAESIEHSRQALTGYQALGYKRLTGYALGNLAIAYDSLGNRPLAEENYLQALRVHQESNNRYEVAFTLKNLASFELKKNAAELALAHALEARKIAAELKATDILMQSLAILTKCALHQNDFRKAFLWQQNYNELKDAAFEEEKTRAVFELEARYESEKKDRALESQRLALIEKDLKIQKSRITQIALGGTIVILLIGGLLVQARIRLRYQRRLEEEKLARQEELLRAVISSVEGERKRFSEDLHDSFGQLISVLKMNVDSLSLQDATHTARQRIFDQSVQVLNEMYGELKNVCFNLMPKTLIQHGLPAAINELATRINQAGKIRAESAFFDLDSRLTDIQEISLYRIVQEWTNNVLKYSDAGRISIQLTRDEQEITLTIEDDGMGFDENLLKEGKGNGWKNLQSRANLMRAMLELDTQPHRRGNMLTVNVPVLAPAARQSELANMLQGISLLSF